MAPNRTSDARLKHVLKLLREFGGNQLQAAQSQTDVSYNTFLAQSRVARQRFPELWTETGNGRPRKAATTVEQDRTERNRQAAQKLLEEKNRKLMALNAELEERLKNLEHSLSGSWKPAEWTLPTRTPKKREHTPYLFTSDMQIGEVIDPAETESRFGFNSKIFIKRYRGLIDTVIYLSFEHAGHDWKYPGIIYVRGGDTLSGGIHEELRETDDLTPIQAVELAFEEESAGIGKLADAFGAVEVKAPGAAGNHDRTTFKPRTKAVDAHSFDRTINYMLRHHFRNDKRITFQVSAGFDVRFPIYDQQILVTHGDRIGSRGGQGFIGPAATILRGAQKIIMEQAALGFHVDRVDMGHHHYPLLLDWVMCNGCFPGYSEFAKSFRMRPSAPQQTLLYHHPKRGVVDFKPIYLVGG